MNKVLNGRLAGRTIESDAAIIVQPCLADDGDSVFNERYQRDNNGDWILIEEERPTWSLEEQSRKSLAADFGYWVSE